MNLPLHIYSHQYLDTAQTWPFILQDQLHEFERSGLMNAADILTVVAIGDRSQLVQIEQILSRYPKTQLHWHLKTNEIQDERITLNQLWEDSKKSDYYCLYTHNKGITAWEKYFQYNAKFFHNYYYWRKYLEWAVIENWKTCIQMLETFEIVGVNFNVGPCPHFSGNMWWSTSEYVSKLDNINHSPWWSTVRNRFDNDRMISEMWPCHAAERIGSIHNPPLELCWPNPGVYSVPWTRAHYT